MTLPKFSKDSGREQLLGWPPENLKWNHSESSVGQNPPLMGFSVTLAGGVWRHYRVSQISIQVQVETFWRFLTPSRASAEAPAKEEMIPCPYHQVSSSTGKMGSERKTWREEKGQGQKSLRR